MITPTDMKHLRRCVELARWAAAHAGLKFVLLEPTAAPRAYRGTCDDPPGPTEVIVELGVHGDMLSMVTRSYPANACDPTDFEHQTRVK